MAWSSRQLGKPNKMPPKLVTPTHEESRLLRSSSFARGPADLPALSRCRGCGSSPFIAVRQDTDFLRKNASPGASSIGSSVGSAPLGPFPLARAPHAACASCLERPRPRAGTCSDVSAASAPAAFVASCISKPFLTSRCKHAALNPSQLRTSCASLSAIDTLLCLPAMQLIRTATQPPRLRSSLRSSVSTVRSYSTSFSRKEKKLLRSSSSSPVNRWQRCSGGGGWLDRSKWWMRGKCSSTCVGP